MMTQDKLSRLILIIIGAILLIIDNLLNTQNHH